MKQIYFFTAVLLFISSSLIAQNRIGGVRVYPIQLQEKNDSLFLDMDVFMDGKAMNSCQSWTIMPCLVTADSTYILEMPRALVNGKIKAKLFKRKLKFRNDYLLDNYPAYKIDKKRNEDVKFHYSYQIPYELWMDTASLHIHQILNSCANVDQYFVLENLAHVELEEYIAYQPVTRVNHIEPVKEVKTLHLEGSAYLDFQVGRSEILPNFRRNPEELAKINEVLSQVRANSDFEISALYITGYASPEGSWASNDRLSLARAEALKQYIQGRFSISNQLIRVGNVAEDWDGLKKLLDEGEMDGKYRVLDVMESVSDPDQRESRLKALDGGRPYRYLLNEIFPKLRRVEYRVEFTVKEYSLEESEQIMEKNPEQLNHYELSLLYQNYSEGSAEREYISNIILRMYPDDPVANNNAVLRTLEQGDVDRATQYIDKIGDFPEAYNTLGIYYMLTDDPDKAEGYFNRAMVVAGEDMPYTREDIEHNLKELDKKREDLRIRERYKNRQDV